MKKDKLKNICQGVLWWLTISVIMPFKLKYLEKWQRWALVLISPAAVIMWCFVYYAFDFPLRYNKVPCHSPKEIAAITEIAEFPNFEYVDNRHSNFYNTTTAQYEFIKETDVEKLFAILEQKLKDPDNIFWTKIPVTDSEDIDFFGSNYVYCCDRGWDGSYMELPCEGITDKLQTSIFIGKLGFRVLVSYADALQLQNYIIPDSMAALTGVVFPQYKLVNCGVKDVSMMDVAREGELKLNMKPSNNFLHRIDSQKNWKKQDDGTYEFRVKNKDVEQIVIVNPDSKIVRVSYSTY